MLPFSLKLLLKLHKILTRLGLHFDDSLRNHYLKEFYLFLKRSLSQLGAIVRKVLSFRSRQSLIISLCSHDISPCELIGALNEHIDFFKSGNGEQSSNR